MKSLKAICLALICLMLPLAAVAAELPAEVSAMLEKQYPGYTVSAQAGGGNEAQGQIALVLSKDGHNVLCIAEKAAGDAEYALTVKTDTALRQGDKLPDLLIDSAGDVLFYTYQDEYYIYRYHTEKTRDGWGNVDVTRISLDERHHEYTLSMQGQNLYIREMVFDENDNMLYLDTILPLYAPWLEAAFRLQAFDLAAWNMENYSDVYIRSAQTLLGDSYTVSDAVATPYMLLADAADAQGVRYLFLIEIEGGGNYIITRSAPMGDGIRPDFVHAWSDVGIRVYPDFAVQEDYSIYGFVKCADELWHLRGVMTKDDIFRYTAYGLQFDMDTWWIGDYPEVLLTAVDWDALPKSLAEAMDTLNQSGWARVISDDPNNRLHLRTAPDKNAASLGKYYRGTPVRVLGKSGDWTEVDVFGVHGYMMTKWLAFGTDMNDVEIATLYLTYKGDFAGRRHPRVRFPVGRCSHRHADAGPLPARSLYYRRGPVTNGITSCSRKPALLVTSGRIRCGRETAEASPKKPPGIHLRIPGGLLFLSVYCNTVPSAALTKRFCQR